MKVYRVTRTRNRPIYGAWSDTGTQVKIVTKRSLSAMLSAEPEPPRKGTYTITKVEEAEVGEFTDVTDDYV